MRFLFLLAFSSILFGQRLEFMVLKEGVLQERLRLAHPKNAERYARLKELFAQTGCQGDSFREQPAKGTKEPNLICDVAGNGESPRKIIVGAHFDSDGGDGVIDNWSGAILLPSLSAFLRQRPRRHSFEFVGFTGEEKGLLGSRAYLKSIAKEDRQQIAAVITMDSLGLTSTKCWPNGSSKELMNAAAGIAHALHLEFGGVNVDQVGTTDSVVFQEAHIPALSLHSVTQETWQLINSKKDVWAALSWKDYYDTHRLISALLVYLDTTLP
jgi:hypothetical protein